MTDNIETEELTASPLQSGVIDLDKYARLIHYPDHWDTAVYPTLDDAITELLGCVGCSECAYETAGQ